MTGFGRTGPYANAKAYEALVMARVGALWASQSMVAREGPAHVSVPYCSYGASQQLLAGHLRRAARTRTQRRGTARRSHAGQRAGVARHLELVPERHHVEVPRRLHALVTHRASTDCRSLPMVFMLLIALSKDGRWLQFSQVQLHLYMEMLKVMGLDWMLQDEEWKDAVWAADTPKTGEFWDKLYEAVQSKDLVEWNEVFDNDHDVWAETMRRGSELLDHPQMQHLGAVVEIDDRRARSRAPAGADRQDVRLAGRARAGRARARRRRAGLRAAPWDDVGAADRACPAPGRRPGRRRSAT